MYVNIDLGIEHTRYNVNRIERDYVSCVCIVCLYLYTSLSLSRYPMLEPIYIGRITSSKADTEARSMDS